MLLGDGTTLCSHYVIANASVCDIGAPTRRVEFFGNIFALPNSSWTPTACIKIFERNSKGFYMIVQVK